MLFGVNYDIMFLSRVQIETLKRQGTKVRIIKKRAGVNTLKCAVFA